MPNVTAWPSAAGGKGFKPLADWTKSLGLKLGIHVRPCSRRAAASSLQPLFTHAVANPSPPPPPPPPPSPS